MNMIDVWNLFYEYFITVVRYYVSSTFWRGRKLSDAHICIDFVKVRTKNEDNFSYSVDQSKDVIW